MSKERRSFPRFPVDIPVEVRVPANSNTAQMFPALASNLSRTSIQISCQAELVSALLRQQQLPFTCELAFVLPWHKHAFKLSAQVVTHRRVSQHQYVLVLLLKHDDERQETLLDDLLNQQQTVGLD